jgi:hypothetical protein
LFIRSIIGSKLNMRLEPGDLLPPVSLIDILDLDHFDVRNNFVLGAEVEHFLSFRDSPDRRSGNAASIRDQQSPDPSEVRAVHLRKSRFHWS